MRILGSTGAAFGERRESVGERFRERQRCPHMKRQRARVSIGFRATIWRNSIRFVGCGQCSIKRDERRKRIAKKMTTNRKEKEWMEED
jgi:hypothetical protein